MSWLERVIHWLEKNEHPRKETEKMSYVPVNVWVPDTQDGSVTESVNLKPCEECHALVPNEFMDAHMANLHTPDVATPH